MSSITSEEKGILRHALGLQQSRRPYRNHFVAGPGHDDWETLLDLENRGLMERQKAPSWIDTGTCVFAVTELGKQEAA